MLHCLFYWFFELSGLTIIILLVRFITLRQLRVQQLLVRLELPELTLLVVEVEYEIEDGFVFTILTYSLVDLVELAHLRRIL